MKRSLFPVLVAFLLGCPLSGINCPTTTPPPPPLPPPPTNGDDCSPTTFTGSHFVGNAVLADPQFVAALNRVNQYARDNNVKVYVTNSYRVDNNNLDDTVVPPVNRSNHLVGHAVDFNVMYGANFGTICNSGCLGTGVDSLPAGVKGFIQALRNDAGLRWGGDFSTPDVVHLDDALNRNNPQQWDERYAAMRGQGTACDDGTADECAENGWYNDGECDTFCPSPDPDCDIIPQPCQQGNCSPGYCVAANTNKKCCPPGYLYYWADGRCHEMAPWEQGGGCPAPGDVACSCPEQHSCLGYTCGGGSTLYHADGLYCGDFDCR